MKKEINLRLIKAPVSDTIIKVIIKGVLFFPGNRKERPLVPGRP